MFGHEYHRHVLLPNAPYDPNGWVCVVELKVPSSGENKLLVQRVQYDSEAFEEDVLPMLMEFMSHKDNGTIPNLLPGQDQAFLRQILKDYRGQHVSSVRLYTHGLNAI